MSTMVPMSPPITAATAAAATSKEVEESEGVKAAAAAAEKVESVEASTRRRRWRNASGSSGNDKENNTTTTSSKSATVAIVSTTTTPPKSRSSRISSNWGLWRSSNDNDSNGTPKSSSSRRSFGISPKAFHAAAAPPVPAAHGLSSLTAATTTTTTTSDHALLLPATTITNNKKKAGQESVLQLHAMVQSNLIKEGKKQVMQRQKLKRSAYQQVTCLKTWPLQERALIHYQQLLNQHLHRQTAAAATTTTPNAAAATTGNAPTTIQEEEETSGSGQQHLSTPTAVNAAAAAANHHHAGTLSASSLSSTSSSSSSVFSIENEPKRLLRDLCLSPAKSRLKFQLQQEFLQQQALDKRRPSSRSERDCDDSDFGPALWCMEPRVFSVEKSETGKRKYVVGHVGRFFDYYWRKVNRNHRHYYELIPHDTPCRLYLDLEFHKHTNPNITNDVAEEFLSQLLHSLSRQLQESFPHQFGNNGTGEESDFQLLDRTHIVDLDSSTENKFSRHWIVHLPGGYLFAHTSALGRFMQEWVGNILFASQQQQQYAQSGNSDEKANSGSSNNNNTSVLFEHLFVNPPPSSSTSKPATVSASGHVNNNKTCLIDLGVYTRNRLFRLMGSTKFGKPPSAALRIADANEFAFPEGFGNESFYLPAMTEHQKLYEQQQQQEPLSSQESKQSNNDDTVEVAVEKFQAAIDWTTHAEALAQTLVIPLNASKIDFPILPFDNKEAAANASSGPAKANIANKKSSSSFPSLSSSSLSFGRSPFPMVDDFVLQTLATRGGGGDGSEGIIQGSIRCWSLECHPETGVPLYLTFQMSRNRYCECVGRAHKSNNIAWRVDLVLMQAVQTCHDPECRALQFRGTPVPLPYSVQQQIQQQLQSESATANDNKNDDDCYDDDDDGFEGVGDDAILKALAAMNLEELECRVAAEDGGAAVPPAAQQQQQRQDGSAKENVESPTSDDRDKFDDDDFPDDALAEAILSNPELFP